MKKMTKFLLVSAMFTGLPTLAMATEVEEGRSLYLNKQCFVCHGYDGKTTMMPSYPKLAGQNYQYLIDQMKNLGSGKRYTLLTAPGIYQNLTTEEMKLIATYLSKIK
jgi:cytochrome c